MPDRLVPRLANSFVCSGSFGHSPTAVASYLCPFSLCNFMKKYIDYTYLLVSASSHRSIPLELEHIGRWALPNNLKLNANKSREVIVEICSSYDPTQSSGSNL